MSNAYVPMPMTCHPFYEDQADGIRRHLGSGYTLTVMEPSSLPAASYLDSFEEVTPLAATTRQRILEIKKCYGPAPFVGDPRMMRGGYFWKVAIDDLGRHIAGEAELELHPRF